MTENDTIDTPKTWPSIFPDSLIYKTFSIYIKELFSQEAKYISKTKVQTESAI
jgi:hypothetical protein